MKKRKCTPLSISLRRGGRNGVVGFSLVRRDGNNRRLRDRRVVEMRDGAAITLEDVDDVVDSSSSRRSRDARRGAGIYDDVAILVDGVVDVVIEESSSWSRKTLFCAEIEVVMKISRSNIINVEMIFFLNRPRLWTMEAFYRQKKV